MENRSSIVVASGERTLSLGNPVMQLSALGVFCSPALAQNEPFARQAAAHASNVPPQQQEQALPAAAAAVTLGSQDSVPPSSGRLE